ncbi:thymidylate synthase [Massilia rhizosphaerae]|uniref:thymidylate synthase n=1 Tax=Massilia rhizosphaerae TaxID=2784389 RepID=UPI0018DDCD72|nr:thymidylate synthase [Massilia rhizosphaerae]
MTKKHPVTTAPVLVDESNLSRAWAKAALYALDHSGSEISPLIISVTGFDDNGDAQEDSVVRGELDKLLFSKNYRSVADVAFTIFPQRLWKISQGDREKLFEYYHSAFPRYQAMNRKGNNRGLYFERLTKYGRGPCEGNQLEWILSQYNGRGGVRRSMFQASVFDPERDHIATAQLQFPCLQHVSFEPTPEGLVINAFYATQQLFVKAYGNYLGLAQLGAFMAHEMKLKLIRMNVVVGVAKFERISKNASELSPLVNACRNCVEGYGSTVIAA